MRSARSTAGDDFGRHDVPRLRRALARAREVRFYRRVQAVLVAAGRGGGEVSGITGLGRWAVCRWVRAYLASRRVEDLHDRPRSGRPKAAKRITDKRVAKEYGRDPLRLGYMATEWTVPLLAGHLAGKYGCPIGRRTLRRRMKAMGLAWKRPRYVFHLKDPHGAQKKGRSSAA